MPTRITRLAPIAVLLACSRLVGRPEGMPASPVVTPPAVVASPSVVAPPGSGLISDEECLARGGQIVTQDTWRHLDRRDPDGPRTPFRACHVPSPRNGLDCKGDADCGGGRCFCTGALSRPDPENDPALLALDGTAATGRCSDEPVASGSWWCLVVAGEVHVHGIIVD